MKIAYLNYGAPPTRGGIIRYLHHTASALVKAGHEVRVWAAEARICEPETRVLDGVAYSVCPTQIRPRSADGIVPGNPHGPPVEAVSSWKPDIIHVHTSMGWSLPALIRLQEAGISMIFTLSNYYHMCPHLECCASERPCAGPDPLACSACENWNAGSTRPSPSDMAQYHDISRTLLNGAAGIIAISTRVREIHEEFGIRKDLFCRIPLVSHACDTLRRRRPRRPAGAVRFGFFTTLAPIKGPHLAIEAFKRLRDSSRAQLHFWGWGRDDYMRRLFSMAGPLRGTSILFHGAYELDDLQGILDLVDVALVTPCWEEAQGMVVQEALAAGVPVIATKMGGVSEWITDKVNGRLIPFDSSAVDSLSHAIQEVTDLPSLISEWSSALPEVPRVPEHANELVRFYTDVRPAA